MLKSRSFHAVILMKISSPDFKNNENIPRKYTCQGDNINPSLKFSDIPVGTKSLALIMDDPDAPNETFVHWVLFDMPVVDGIEENSYKGNEGINSINEKGYTGPCPPSGTHRYFFKLYALDTKFNLKNAIKKQDLEKKMKGHILAKAELIGLYKKS